MNINIEKVNNSTVFKLEGRLDTVTAPELEQAINNEGDALVNLVLDFGGINYISSAGLRVLLGAQKKMNAQGSMELINVSDDVMDILEMTGFADILVIK
ncbi:MAG: STAS domain-containing protein [Acutalibacteraceae bacterium]|nr:STAS domain-containing protein [Acutalibacteraceae bacterium]